MGRTLGRLGGALLAALVGLAMIFWGVERLALLDAAQTQSGVESDVPIRVYLTLFVGLSALNISVYAALTVWSRFLRANPGIRQPKPWVLIVALLLVGGAGLTSFAMHAGHLRTLDPVPMDVDQGFVAFQAVAATFVVGCLVALGARWTPGQRRSLPES